MKALSCHQITHCVYACTDGGTDRQGEEKSKEKDDVYINLFLYSGPLDRRSPMDVSGVRT